MDLRHPDPRLLSNYGSTSHHKELAPEMQRLSDVQEHEVLLTSNLNLDLHLNTRCEVIMKSKIHVAAVLHMRS